MNSSSDVPVWTELMLTFIVRSVLRGCNFNEVLGMVFSVEKVRNLETLRKNQKLAISIVLVGTGHRRFFPMIARLVSDFHYTQGPFWVVQEELIRQAIIFQFEEIVKQHPAPVFDIDKAQMAESMFSCVVKNIPDILPECSIYHPLSKMKISLLKIEIEKLVVEIIKAEYPEVSTGSWLTSIL
jgi:hypothetical protein